MMRVTEATMQCWLDALRNGPYVNPPRYPTDGVSMMQVMIGRKFQVNHDQVDDTIIVSNDDQA